MQGLSDKRIGWGPWGLLLVFLNGAAMASTELKVCDAHALLRASPSETAEVVFKAAEGDILIADKGISGEWIEVVPPTGVNFWVYGELVNNGVVASSRLQVRIGPGIDYKAVGELSKDTRLSVRGEYKDWLKIEAPAGCRLWVSRKSVDPVDKPLGAGETVKPAPVQVDKAGPAAKGDVKHEAGKKPQAVKKPVERGSGEPVIKKEPPDVVAVVEKPEPPKKKAAGVSPENSIRDKLVSTKEQGRSVRRDGILRLTGLFVWRQPSKYRLVVHDNNGVPLTVCYVLGEEKTLVSMQDRDVVVQGREYWLQGVRQPVVIFDKIFSKE